MGERDHHLFGTTVNTSDERDLFHNPFPQMHQTFAENICGEHADKHDGQQGHDNPQKGNAIAFGNWNIRLDQQVSEKRGKGIEISE